MANPSGTSGEPKLGKRFAIEIPYSNASPDRYALDDQHAFSPPSPVGLVPLNFLNRIADTPPATKPTRDTTPPSYSPPPGFRGRRKSSLRVVDAAQGIAQLELECARSQYDDTKGFTSSTLIDEQKKKASPAKQSYDLGGKLKSDHKLAEFTSPFRGQSQEPTSLLLAPPPTPTLQATPTLRSSASTGHLGSLVQRIAAPFISTIGGGTNQGGAGGALSTTSASHVAAAVDKSTSSSNSGVSYFGSASSAAKNGRSISSTSTNPFSAAFYRNFNPDSKRDMNFMAPLSN